MLSSPSCYHGEVEGVPPFSPDTVLDVSCCDGSMNQSLEAARSIQPRKFAFPRPQLCVVKRRSTVNRECFEDFIPTSPSGMKDV